MLWFAVLFLWACLQAQVPGDRYILHGLQSWDRILTGLDPDTGVQSLGFYIEYGGRADWTYLVEGAQGWVGKIFNRLIGWLD